MIALVLAATFTRPLERVTTMDPAFSQTVYDARSVKLVYETPLEVDYYARPYRLTAGACELPEVSGDGLVYRFKMRSKEATAEDMVRSLERLRDPETVSPNAWMLDAADTIEADGDTVEIRLKKRFHCLPWLMAMAPAAIVKADGSGTGEYELAKWRKNHEMVFARKKPVPGGFDTVRYLVVDDVSTQWLMFLKGEVDFLGEIPRDNWDAAMTAEGKLAPGLAAQGIELHTIPTLETIYVGFNMKDPVVGGNRALRQALNAAFDFPAWEKYYRGRVLAADGPVPPGVAGKLDAPFGYSFDPEKAKALLAEAGYPGGIDPKTGRRLVLTLSMGRASQDSRESGELLASFYERIGVKLELKFLTWDAFVRAVNDGRTQMYRIGWVGDYPDAQNFLQLFHSKNMPPGPNHSAYSNAEFDREYDLATEARSEEERNAHWRRCQEIVREDCPWVFANFNLASSLVRPRVGNYVASDFPYGQERYLKARDGR
ncbi:MAG: hypothetical protein ILO34_07025 [Kiritimatiellae bacterium]|nr:hypothetical protein [Kiritimatiellia bacterium]